MTTSWTSLLLLLACASLSAAAEPVDYVFLEQPGTGVAPAQPLPKFRFLFGEAARWRGTMRWYYNPANAPGAFGDVDGTVANLKRTLDIWGRSCAVTYEYAGLTTTAPNHLVDGQPDNVNVVGWGTLPNQTAGLTYAWYRRGGNGPELTDADVILSPDRVTSPQAMERTAKHEWGHAIGLAHSNRPGMLMSGPPDTAYNGLTSVEFDDVRGCRCLYGAPASQPAGYACSVPDALDLGDVPIGAPSVPRTLSIRNDGNGPLTVSTRTVEGPGLAVDGGCSAGTSIATGASCTMTLTATAPAAGQYSALVLVNTDDGPYLTAVSFRGTTAGSPPAPSVASIEYFHAGFGHYFVTSLPGEIAVLDDGTLAGWQRTGRSFRAWAQAQLLPPTVPVCRFFSDHFLPKISHFYTASAQECADTKRNPDWLFEGEVFHIALPDAQGNCAAGTLPVYRLYNDGAGGAPNHRFTTDADVRAAMIVQGWRPEGTGLGVTMCAAP